ncbi:hypothetical protein KFK09_029317 [Dendrobium nobile]|uniref:Haloacid dehalogenase-like hydrolase family protein n=1 Tax=Dendrobium nobile TaxID=94219 RepID=A0A8T3A193_DENNO|nr:hypothetical protein KFK09_029317 [Dendrobium nobile]
MAIFFARALPFTSSRPSLSFGPLVAAALRQRPTASVENLSLLLSSPTVMPLFSVSWPRRSYYISKPTLRPPIPPRGVGENVRGFRRGRWRRRPAARKKLRKERQPELVVRICIEEDLPDDSEIMLMLGDIVISIETAVKQADERDHSLLDEVRILMVHGLLHLLGFDHEVSNLAEEEMEKEEELVLTTLGWKGKGLIKSAYDSISNGSHQAQALDETDRSIVEVDAFPCRQKISYIFCDMDGTLLNSKSQITLRTVEALNEAISRGVRIVIATGKSRSAVMRAFKTANLAGKGDIVNESSPGVFLQGLLVYGRKGREICRRNLDRNVCKEILSYSLEHSVPAVAFSEDRCFTVFDHPLVESLHEIYHEPKKLLFLDTAEGISSTLRPYWSAATRGQATVVQAVPDMLEIIPLGASKGNGVKLLLDHLGVSAKEVMAIGDGENDVEMLKLASLGIALANGSDKAKAAADVIGLTNDEDGVAEAIYKYVL